MRACEACVATPRGLARNQTGARSKARARARTCAVGPQDQVQSRARVHSHLVVRHEVLHADLRAKRGERQPQQRPGQVVPFALAGEGDSRQRRRRHAAEAGARNRRGRTSRTVPAGKSGAKRCFRAAGWCTGWSSSSSDSTSTSLSSSSRARRDMATRPATRALQRV
jgi:hypothetical protein